MHTPWTKMDCRHQQRSFVRDDVKRPVLCWDDPTFNTFVGASDHLLGSINGLVTTAEPEVYAVGYFVAKVAEMKRHR